MAEKRQNHEDRPKSRTISFTIFAALAVFIYIGAMFIRFLTQSSPQYVVAREGSVEESFTVQGVVTREELLLTASEGGVIRYYYPGGKKLARNTKVGVMMDSYYGGLLDQKLSEIYSRLEEADTEPGSGAEQLQEEMDAAIRQYLQTKDMSCFDSLYELKETLETCASRRQELFALSSNKTVLNLLEEQGVYLKEKEAEEKNLWLSRGGILEYSYDGYEGWTPGQITRDFISRYSGEYQYLNVQLQEREKGDVLYRLIASENWNITVFLTEDQARSLSGKDTVTFWYNEEEKMKATVVSLTEDGEDWYKMVLALDSRMQAHDCERIAKLKFVEETRSGIKISDSCLVEKEFCSVPESYIVKSGSRTGVMKQTEQGVSFVQVSVQRREDGKAYFLLTDELKAGERIREEGTEQTMTVDNNSRLTGVYVMNGSSQKFTPVKVICHEEGYSIVEGIQLYDRLLIPEKEGEAS